MYFYPKFISKQAVASLNAAGLHFTNGNEMFIDEKDITQNEADTMTVRGVQLVRKQITFNGHREPPMTYSSLEGALVYSGVDTFQCETCGYWMDRKMTFSDEKRHDQQCYPRYKWWLAGEETNV